jgi:hypothetical protein
MKLVIALAATVGLLTSCTYNNPDEVSPEKKKESAADPLKRSAEIVQASGGALVATLSGKIEQGGVEAAIPFCNVKALPITDSLAAAHGAYIKRTSLRYRNPDNAPNDREREILTKWDIAVGRGEKAEAFTEVNADGTISAFHPIFTAELCLKCHGIPGETMMPETMDILDSLYPQDLARDYQAGELRGMWVVRMKQ